MIEFKPTLKQHHAWCLLQDNKTTHILYGGSVGSGKSYLGCMWVFLSCIQFPGTRYLIGRSRLNVLKRTTLKTLLDIIKTNKMEEDVVFNSQNSTVHFRNGSEIIFIDLFPYPADPDYDRLGSMEITGAFIDELSEISYKGFEVLYTRIRYKLNEYNLQPKLFCASNPAQGWAKNFFYRPFVEGTQKENVKFIQALPTDNKYLPKQYLEGLSNTLTSGLKQRLLYGSWDFDADDYTLFNYDALSNSFYNEYFNNIDAQNYLTADIAELGNDKTIICIWKGWSLVKLIELVKSEIIDTAAKIKELLNYYHIPINHCIIDSVGVGAGVASILRGCIRYLGSEKALNGEKYRNIKAQLMYHFSNQINTNGVHFNFNYDDSLVQEALLYKKEIKGEMAGVVSKDEIKQRLGRSPDKIDAIYLRSYFAFKKTNTNRYTII